MYDDKYAGNNIYFVVDNTFKIGSTSVQMPLNIYATMNHTNQYINNRLTVKDNIIIIYAKNTNSTSNIRVSFDRGSTWEDRHCSYAPAGKIIVGGDGRAIFRWGTGSSIKL